MPVTEKMTHSAMFTAWSPMRSKYLAIIKRSIARSPLAGFWAICAISSCFIDEHNIAKQAAFVNHYAEMRFWWKAACFLLGVVLLFNHFCINQPTVLVAIFLVQFECAGDRNLAA